MFFKKKKIAFIVFFTVSVHVLSLSVLYYKLNTTNLWSTNMQIIIKIWKGKREGRENVITMYFCIDILESKDMSRLFFRAALSFMPFVLPSDSSLIPINHIY